MGVKGHIPLSPGQLCLFALPVGCAKYQPPSRDHRPVSPQPPQPWLWASVIPVSLKGKHQAEPEEPRRTVGLAIASGLQGHLDFFPMNWLLWRGRPGRRPSWRQGTLWGQLVQQREAGLASGLWCKARVGDNKVKILEFGDRPEPWREKGSQTQSKVLTWGDEGGQGGKGDRGFWGGR